MFTRRSLAKFCTPLIDLYVKILNLFCDKQPSQFSYFIGEYVSFLKELAAISARRYRGEISTTQTVQVRAFVSPDPVELAPNCVFVMEGLELKSEKECVVLQLNITKVILLVSYCNSCAFSNLLLQF